MLMDPTAVGELQEQRAIEPARRSLVDILDGCQVAQFGGAGSRLEPLLLSQCHLVLEQNAKPFHMVESFAFRIGCEIAQALGHAVEAELAQPVDRGML